LPEFIAVDNTHNEVMHPIILQLLLLLLSPTLPYKKKYTPHSTPWTWDRDELQ